MASSVQNNALISTITKSSGETAITTSSDSAVTAIAADSTNDYYNVRAINEGSTNGFLSVDGGTTWHRFPAFSIIEMRTIISNVAVSVKRISGGDDLSDIYVSIW